MPIPVAPPIPEDRPVPLYVAPIMDLQRRARFWARLSGALTMLVLVVAGYLAYQGQIGWVWVALLLPVPFVPIAAETRIVELGRKLEDQVRDRLFEDAKDAVEANPRERS